MSSNSSKLVTVVVSDKLAIELPEHRLTVGRSHGLSDVAIAKAFVALEGNKAGTVMMLDDPGYWTLQRELSVKRARCSLNVRAAMRSERIADDLKERLARAQSLLGISEADATVLKSAAKVLVTPKAEKEQALQVEQAPQATAAKGIESEQAPQTSTSKGKGNGKGNGKATTQAVQ
jgi:hypothetical protein